MTGSYSWRLLKESSSVKSPSLHDPDKRAGQTVSGEVMAMERKLSRRARERVTGGGQSSGSLLYSPGKRKSPAEEFFQLLPTYKVCDG